MIAYKYFRVSTFNYYIALGMVYHLYLVATFFSGFYQPAGRV
jgi:hypothetical protein